MDAVPCRGCRGDGRSVIDRCPCEHPEAFIAQPEYRAQGRKDQGCDHVEQKDNRDGLRHFFIGCINDRGSGGDGAPAADRRPHTHKDGVICTELERLVQNKGCDQGSGDGGKYDGEGLLPFCQDLSQVHSKAQEYDSSLEDLFRSIVDPRGKGILFSKDECDDHAGQDRKYRAADHRDCLSEKP